MNALTNIGFNITSPEEFAKILDDAYQNGQMIQVDNGAYVHYADKSGAELWIQFDEEENPCGVCPFYQGEHVNSVELTLRVDSPKSNLEGIYGAALELQDTGIVHIGSHAVMFNVPNFATVADRTLPQKAVIRLTAFSEFIKCFDTDEEYCSEEGMGTNRKPFYAFDMSEDEEGEEELITPEAYATFAATVLEVKPKHNQLTGQDFLWMSVALEGNVLIDVVVNPEHLEGTPRKEGVIFGTFWMLGTII